MTLRRWIPLFIALLMAGCATAPKPAERGTLSADEILNRVMRNGTLMKNFGAEGSMTVSTPTMNQSVGFELAARGTDSVKLSVFGPFGITVGAALFTRREFIAYNALNNTVYRGSPEHPLKMLPFLKDIPFEQFMGSLQGIHTLRSSASIDSFRSRTDGGYSFSVVNENGTYDAFMYNSSLDRITRCTRKNSDGTSLWMVRYEYKRSESGDVVPEQVEVSIPAKESSLLIEYAGIADSGAENDFSLPYPDDAEVVIIE